MNETQSAPVHSQSGVVFKEDVRTGHAPGYPAWSMTASMLARCSWCSMLTRPSSHARLRLKHVLQSGTGP
jgi:hypothetical protein